MIVGENMLEIIGRTPIVKLAKLPTPSCAALYCKLEMFNPSGSVKDRIAVSMIAEAEASGTLKPGMTIIEPTSGNIGISLAMVAAVKEYKLILTIPETVSEERKAMLASFGAKLVLTPAKEGMRGAIRKAMQLLEENPDYFMPKSFENPANPSAHALNTAKEIIEQLGGAPDAFVCGVGTGGTISGAGAELRKANKDILIVAVEPKNSSVLSRKSPGQHSIIGLGPGFIPEVLDASVYDEILRVEDEAAIKTMKLLALQEGVLAGVSSGAAVYAALKIARRLGKEKRALTILPDTGERYLSSGLFSADKQK